MIATYTMRNLNSYVGERVIVRQAPAGLRWEKEYVVTPWVSVAGSPLNEDIPIGEYVIVEKNPDSEAEGSAVSYVLKAA
jgi:hypothetical protein